VRRMAKGRSVHPLLMDDRYLMIRTGETTAMQLGFDLYGHFRLVAGKCNELGQCVDASCGLVCCSNLKLAVQVAGNHGMTTGCMTDLLGI